MKLYLAHPFMSRKDVWIWEHEIEAEYGIELVNPFYDTDREDIHRIDAGEMPRYTVSAGVVDDDLELIEDCDGIVAIIDGATSYGTIMEIVYAFLHNKSVYIICTNNHQEHPWLRYHADEIFTSREEFEKWLLE